MDHLRSLITIREIEFLNLKLMKKNSPGLYGFTGECYQMFQEEAIPILHDVLEKMRGRITFQLIL